MPWADWDSFTKKHDWDTVFNWFYFVTMLLVVLPADCYIRAQIPDTAGPLAWALLLPLPAYLLFFMTRHRSLVFGLALVNACAFLYAMSHFYWQTLLPLIVNIGSEGIFFTMAFQAVFFFGFVFHLVMVRRFWPMY